MKKTGGAEDGEVWAERGLHGPYPPTVLTVSGRQHKASLGPDRLAHSQRRSAQGVARLWQTSLAHATWRASLAPPQRAPREGSRKRQPSQTV